MQLFHEHGFENVTVEQIALQAGVTSRTFYRYFGDKQEVLFFGSEVLSDSLVQAVTDAASSAAPLDAVAAALAAVAKLVGGDHAHSVRRRAIIQADPGLRERELAKFAGWSRSLAAALLAMGEPPATANLAAAIGLAVFRCAFEQWTDDVEAQEFADVLSKTFDELRTMTASPSTR